MNTSADVESLFGQALEIASPADRAAFLDQVCRDNPALRAELEGLLKASAKAGQFMNRPAGPTGATTVPLEVPSDPIGPYKLLQKLGEGGMGTVFLAEQEHPVRRRVALKVIRAGMDSREIVARFEQERQALAMMDHPNIAKVLDAGSTNAGLPFVVMELVKGIPITKFCDQERLTPKERLELFIPVCHAVQHAHQKGIIHRDLKPSNVLIALYDDRPVPKVIDFGVAKAIGRTLSERTLFTEVGVLVGTFEYMAPEQATLNNLDIDTRADIYSLGVILYELLTGTQPFTSKHLRDAGLAEMLKFIQEVEPQKPSTRLSSSDALPSIAATRKLEPKSLTRLVAGELDWIVMKCLEKERGRRYATPNDLAMDMQRYLADEPVLAGPPSARYRLRKFVRKHRSWITVAAAFALLLTVAAGLSVALAVWAIHERNVAVAEKHRANEQSDIAKAVNDFLQKDMLGQADIANQPRGERDRDVKVREALDRAAKGIGERFTEQPLTEAAIRLTLGKAYAALGEYAEAQKHFERALQLRKEKLSAGHQDVLEVVHHLAGVWVDRGNYEEAERLYKQALEGRRKTLGDDHRDTLDSLDALGLVYCERSRFQEAELFLKQAFEMRSHTLGPDHLDTLKSVMNLGYYHSSKRENSRAAARFKQAIVGWRDKLGADHPYILDAMHSLAQTHLNLDQVDEAESLLNDVFEAHRLKLGPEHPRTVSVMQSLASLYQKRRRYDEAEALFKQVIQSQLAKFGPDHDVTLGSQNNLAVFYMDRNRPDLAEPLMEHVVNSLRRTLGSDHIQTLAVLQNLAVIYRDTGKFEKAEASFREAVATARTKLGLTDDVTAGFISNLCHLYLRQGTPERGEDLITELAAGVRKKVGPEHLAYANHLGTLSQILIMQKKYVEAEPVARECLAIRIKKKPDGFTAFLTRAILGRALWGQQKYAEAEPLLLEGYEGVKQREATIPRDSKFTLTQTLEWLIELYDAWGKEAEAAKWRRELATLKTGATPVDQ